MEMTLIETSVRLTQSAQAIVLDWTYGIEKQKTIPACGQPESKVPQKRKLF